MNGNNGIHGCEHPPSRLKAALAIARRDLLEFIRDRRTLFITLLLPMATYPILALATALGLRTASHEIEARQAPTKILLGVSGEDAKAFVDRLGDVFVNTPRSSRQGWPEDVSCTPVTVGQAPGMLDRGEIDLWVEAEPGLVTALDGDGTLRLPVRVSAVRPAEIHVRDQFRALIRSLANDAARRRVTRAGLPASLLEPLELKFVGDENAAAAPAQNVMSTLAGGVLVLLAVLTMTGAFYPAIDALAGEKERGTIETLLIAPCALGDIVFGKFLAVFAVTLATLAANVVSIAATAAVSLRFLPTGITAAVTGSQVVAVSVTVLSFVGLASLAAAICLAVTTASKSGKEAQNTLTPVILLVSSVAGAALLPGSRGNGLLAMLPFAGHVLVAINAFAPPDGQPQTLATTAFALAASLVSSALLTWLLLRATASILSDEDVLFRGPDVAGGLTRPVPRTRPNIVQGMMPIVAGLAGLWYVQGITPTDLVRAIPLQQAAAVLLPIVVVLAWQRVDLGTTFSLRWPRPKPRAPLILLGAALVGAGLFVLGAAALLAFRGTAISAEAKDLSARLVELMRSNPWWLSWGLMALLPAVCEELLFRGWMLAAFVGDGRHRERLFWGILAQAACFALFHLLPERMPQTFVLGLVLGCLVTLTGSLLTAVVCHAAHNSMPILVLALAGGNDADQMPATGGLDDLPGWAIAAALVTLAVGGLFVASGRLHLSRGEAPR